MKRKPRETVSKKGDGEAQKFQSKATDTWDPGGSLRASEVKPGDNVNESLEGLEVLWLQLPKYWGYSTRAVMSLWK